MTLVEFIFVMLIFVSFELEDVNFDSAITFSMKLDKSIQKGLTWVTPIPFQYIKVSVLHLTCGKTVLFTFFLKSQVLKKPC